MHIGILGTGVVSQTLASALVAAGHRVTVGTRDPSATRVRSERGAFGNPSTAEWLAANPQVVLGTFAEAAAADVVVNATSGAASLAAVEAAGADALAGKILIDVSNPLDFSRGFPPSLSVCNTDSLGEQLQRALPRTRVVKALNTVAAPIMVQPSLLANGEHDMFVCADDADARAQVAAWLKEWFGWKHVVAFGGIANARATEGLLLFWTRMYGNLGTGMFSLHLVR